MTGGGASAQLLDRAASLLQASDFVGEYCAEQREAFAYPEPTLKLFHYAEQIRGRTREYVKQWLDRADRGADAAVEAESNFLILAKFWSELHRYIKPAADAHALIAPSPLLRLAKKRLGGVKGMLKSDFVVLVTEDLNYEHRPRKHLAAIALLFPQASFPPEIGFLAMPYSMGATLFANVVLYHELGHFTYLRLVEASNPGVSGLRKTISDAVDRHVPGFKEKEDWQKTRLVSVVDGWLQELFCDLFAIRLIGPAFSLAFWDFKNILPGDEDEDKRFTTHPAPNARLLFQRRQLQADGWWELLETDPEYQEIPPVARMRSGLAAEPGCYSGASTETEGLVPAFFECVGQIQELVNAVTAGVKSAASAFKANRKRVSTLLANGIVPSYRLDDSHPMLVEAVINAAYLFAPGQIAALEDRMSDNDGGPAAKRHRTIQRIDAWTLKAVEDLQYGPSA